MSRHEITCINKKNRDNTTESISHIGGKNANGTSWKLTVETAIEGIEAKKWEFFVSSNGHEADVYISKSTRGNKYLRTVSDNDREDNLLSLPECS